MQTTTVFNNMRNRCLHFIAAIIASAMVVPVYGQDTGRPEIQNLLQEKTIPSLRNISPDDRIRLTQEATVISKNAMPGPREQAVAVLLKLGDKHTKEKTLGMFRSDNRRYVMRAYYTIVRASEPSLISELDADLFIKESAKDQIYPDEIGSPRSVWSASAITKIILSSGEFPESVVNWAKTLNHDDPERFRAEVRQFVLENRAHLNSEQYQNTQPPKTEKNN